jgi:hypothetical protein
MKTLLVDIDSVNGYENLALKKISAWCKAQGDEVGFCIENPDRVYISCIFPKNAEQARGVARFYPDAEVDIGGSGIDLKKTLPPEIELIKPDYDLYPSTYSQGFTTRGCIRKCPFCFVPEKEGHIRIAQHPSEFHDPRFDTCMIMDNNLFAAPQDWQDSVFEWFSQNKIKMLSPQGWDVRLLNEHRADLLKSVKHAGNIHFAWDNVKDESAVVKGIEILKRTGFNLKHDISFYVLVGFAMVNGTPTKVSISPHDIYRCNRLKELGVNAFVMPYHKKDRIINALAKWANRRWAYWSSPFQFEYHGDIIEMSVKQVRKKVH